MDADTSQQTEFFIANPSNDIAFQGKNGVVLIIHGDSGTLEKGPAWRHDDNKSNEVFDMLALAFPQWKAAVKKEK